MRNNLLFLALIILSSWVSYTEKKTENEKKIETTKEISNILTNKKDTSDATIEMKKFLMGKFKVNEHAKFVLVDKKYHNKRELYLQKEVLGAFIEMHKSAKKDGINLTIISGTRDFYSQKRIWERKFNTNKYYL